MIITILCIFLISVACQAAPTGSKPDHWAVLVAGSNGYYNYRHQADIAHAFQIMKMYGIPESNIVTMMYDDVAHSEENPIKGTLINRPGGQDVYQGVVLDYTKKDVTPSNFLKVLMGDVEGMKGVGSGKVLNTGPNSHIFVNFADHGGPGLLAFPHEVLHVAQLNKTIWEMYHQKKYHKMVMYIEACESGSMFDQTLPTDINIVALTAANATQPSYACYFDKMRMTYLGDVFSVKWMEDSDLGMVAAQSILDQYHTVKAEVNQSHVCVFGDSEIASHYRVAEFQGSMRIGSAAGDVTPMKKYPKQPVSNTVPAPDVPLHITRMKIDLASTEAEREAALEEYAKITFMRKMVDQLMAQIKGKVEDMAGTRLEAEAGLKSGHDCYQSVIETFHSKCFNLGQNGYVLTKLKTFVVMCEVKIPHEEINAIIIESCRNGPWKGAL